MDSVYAMRLSKAARAAKPGGDWIDHGWSLIKALHAEGFDVVPREKLNAMDRRETLNEMAGLAKKRAGPSSDKFLGDGARKLADPDNEDLLRGLEVFMDMWGLDAYTPPQDVEMRVREIVKAMTTAARLEAQRREQS